MKTLPSTGAVLLLFVGLFAIGELKLRLIGGWVDLVRHPTVASEKNSMAFLERKCATYASVIIGTQLASTLSRVPKIEFHSGP